MSISSRRRSLLLAVVLGLAGLLTVSPSATAVTTDACADGVTVVVDFTDLGGEVEVGCADGDPATGRDALESAGFTPTDSIPGMICAIDANPDPCPEEFDGSFWAYWTTENGEWVSHTAGADGTDPAPGDIEGWRYNDGATGPGLTPDEAVAGAGTDAGDTAGELATGAEKPATGADEPATDEAAEAPVADAADPESTDADADRADESSGAAWIWFTVAGIAVIGAVAAYVVRSRRQ